DLVFLVDTSNNLGEKNFNQVKYIISKTIQLLPVGPDKYRIGLAQYNDDLDIGFLLNEYKAKNQVLNHIKNKFSFKGGSLHLGNALKRTREMFFKNGRDKSTYPPILVVMTSESSEDDVNQPALELKQDGVKLITVGLQAAPLSQLIAIASSPNSVIQLSNIQDIASISKSLKQTIQDVVESVTDVPIPAICDEEYSADIVFIIDTSHHQQLQSESLKTFLIDIISRLPINKSCTHVYLVKYGSKPELLAQLETGVSQNAVLNAITSISPLEENTANIGYAINFARTKIIENKKISRKEQGIKQVAILISHRPSSDNITSAAILLRKAKVSVFAMGIAEADHNQMMQIASYPSDNYAIRLSTFSELSSQVDILQNKILNSVEEYILDYAIKTDVIQQGCLDTEVADIYLLIDESGSIDVNNFQEMKTFLVKLIDMFHIGPDKVQIKCNLYATNPREIVIGREFSKDEVKSALQGLIQKGGGTNTGAALNFTRNLITQNIRPGDVPVNLIVLTDGQSQDSVKEAAELIRNLNVNIYAIGVNISSETPLLEITGNRQRIHMVNDFDSLKNIKNVIAQQICYNKTCQGLMADILFLVDSSDGIGQENFNKIKPFLKDLVDRTEVGLGSVQYGVIQFSNSIKEAFQLNKHATNMEIKDAIDNMELLGKSANTGAALKQVADYFKEFKGAREKVKKFLILITDSPSQDEVKAPSDSLRSNNVTIFSVGGFKANRKQLQQISKPVLPFYQSFDKLEAIEEELLFKICNPEQDCKRIALADIVLVIDSSTSIDENEYNEMKKFLTSLVNKSDVGPNNVQFGALKYSDKQTELFHLNKYKTKQEIVNHINSDTIQTGNTHTAEALHFSKQFFTEKHGSRKSSGVPQIVIVITDGESQDNYNLNDTARKLEKEGIVIYAIGIKDANTNELKTMAGSKGKWFMVANFSGLHDILEKVSEGVCNKTECKTEQADLLFLIDGSTTTSQKTFKEIKSFMVSVVDDFNIGSETVHVSVSQYSSSYSREIYFKQFSKKMDLNNKIENIQQLQGEKFIGAALTFTKDTVFVPSKDCRINEGVKQYLVLITAGNSTDDVSIPAQTLRDRGIDIFAVGIGNICKNQLTQITGSPEKKYIVRDSSASALKSIKKRLVKEMCSKDPITNCSLDVVVSFDISTLSRDASLFYGHHNLENLLPKILQAVASMKSPSCSMGKQPQVSVAFNVRDTNTVNRFNTYSLDLFNKLKKVKVNGPSYLDSSSLNFAWNIFETKNSGNAKIILVFTDGLDEDVEKLEETANRLRNQGLTALVTVALENSKNVENLKFIEFGRSFEYNHQLYIGMPGIAAKLARQADHSIETICCCVFCKCYGDRGSSGLYGPLGMKGRDGVKGDQGHRGEDGDPGERGHQGARGDQGTKGCQGTRGIKGNRGFTGDKNGDGENGLDGLQGEEGKTGQSGMKGEKGETGETGSPGSRGSPGEIGSTGHRGDQGDPGAHNPNVGPKGLNGDTGEEGDPGLPGIQGSPGSRGTGNIEGSRGAPGPKGIKGEPGEKGYNGEKGFHGPQGDSGTNGIKGENGSKGSTGIQGQPGIHGNKGNIGRPGITGLKGIKGDPGMDGTKGTKGYKGNHPCELIEFVRDKCRRVPCPAYPVELVLALDMSNVVTPTIYTKILAVAKDILQNITVRESNCPAGARIAVTSYNSNTKYLIRFPDYHNKNKLIKAVESIPLEQSSQSPDVGEAMRYVARNLFKSYLGGATVRRIAVFLSSGQSEDIDSINTAVMEYGALGIIPVVFAFNPAPFIKRAFEIDATRTFQLIEIKANEAYDHLIKLFLSCTLCFDKCRPDKSCDFKPIPPKSYMDITFLLDSSYNVKHEEFEKAKSFLSNMIDQFQIEPMTSDKGDRVALITFTHEPHVEFHLLSYDNKVRIKRHIKENVQQHTGPSALGLSLKHAVENIMANTSNPRKHKVIVIITSGETSMWDKETLTRTSIEAICRGYAVFVLSIGKSYNYSELTEIASRPLDHHLLILGRIHRPDFPYAAGFLQQFLHYVRRGIGKYPPAELKAQCRKL
ncbi:hypothetical protein GDO86_011609, partial [Hymenochirus boettgeri]